MTVEWPEAPDDYFRRFNGVVETLDPVAVVGDSSETVVTKLYDTLFVSEDGRSTEPHLVDTVTTDGESLRLRLKQGVSFHDGSTLSATDVVYSFERIAASPNSARRSYLFDALAVTHERDDDDGEYVPGSLGVQAEDDLTVVIDRTDGDVPPQQVLAHPTFSVVPAGHVNDVPGVDGSVSQETFARNPVGTGPFELERWEPAGDEPGHVVVGQFDDYHGDTPNVGGVNWITNPGDDRRHEHILAQTIDVTGTPDGAFDASLVDVTETDERGREFGTYGPMENGVTMNYAKLPTLGGFHLEFAVDNVPAEVRRAVADVLNQHHEAETVWGENFVPAYHLMGTEVASDSERLRDHRSAYPYGVDERRLDSARNRLSTLGYGLDNPFELTHVTEYTEFWSLTSDRFREDLAAVGIEVDRVDVDPDEKFERRDAGEFDMLSYGWVADWPTEQNRLKPLSPDGGSPSITEALEDPWTELTDAEPGTTESFEAALGVETRNWEEACLIPLYENVTDCIWFDRVDYEPPGALGFRRSKCTDVAVGQREK